MTLEEARDKAKRWWRWIKQGIDPADAEAEEARATARRRADTFATVADRYIADHLADKRKGKIAAREIRRELIAQLGSRPILDIKRRDIVARINEIKARSAPYQARNVLQHARSIFSWCIEQDEFGLEANPCSEIKPKRLIGEKKPRKRVLTELEIAALWRAAGRLFYPMGDFYRLALLTGLRKSEIADGQWPELNPELRRIINEAEKRKQAIDWRAVPNGVKLWTIPAARFKSDSEHLVPLSDAACELIAALPRFRGSKWMFTFDGEKPINGFSKSKRRLDARMLSALRAYARTNGQDTAHVYLEPFVVHDIRRTVRTQLAALRTPDHIAEMVLGHGKRGLQRVYDQHQYIDEMRECLSAWAAKLASLTQSRTPESNVIPLRK